MTALLSRLCAKGRPPRHVSAAALAWALVGIWGGPARADVVTFEDVVLPAAGYLNGDPGDLEPGDSVSLPLVSGSVSFSNTNGVDLVYEYPYWYGFAFSNVVNTTDGTWTNQYASYPGGGYGGSANYAVAYADATIMLPGAAIVAGFQIANTTYARSTMVSADPEKFADPLTAPDGFFTVTATGWRDGSLTGSTAEFFLANFIGETPPGVLAGWAWFDLSGLGTIDAVSFAFDGSDSGDYGLNTAAYFALDDLTFTPVPEPATATLAVAGGAWCLVRWAGRRVGRVRR